MKDDAGNGIVQQEGEMNVGRKTESVPPSKRRRTKAEAAAA